MHVTGFLNYPANEFPLQQSNRDLTNLLSGALAGAKLIQRLRCVTVSGEAGAWGCLAIGVYRENASTLCLPDPCSGCNRPGSWQLLWRL